MKKYNYTLDEKNRIVTLQERVIENELPYIELQDKSEVILGQTGLINNQLVFIGLDDEQKNQIRIHELKHKLPELKKSLEDTDYKVIKCYEAQLGNEEMPYNLQELLAERKAWRDEINQIEFEISMLG